MLLNDFEGLFLDLDGTLVDTEPIHTECHHRVLAAKGIHLSDADIHGNIGGSDLAFYRRLQKEHGVDGDAEDWWQEKRNYLMTRYAAGELAVRPGIRELLAAAEALSLPCCVVTSSDHSVCDLVLRGAGLGERLPMRVCSDDTEKHKPFPDPYLLARKRLGYEHAVPLLAIEDSVPGIQAARAADIFAVGFVGLISEERLLAAGAQLCVNRADQLLATVHE